MKKGYCSRVFLNKPDCDSPAFIRCKIEKYAEYSIAISDCHNRINLHGNVGNKKSRENALYKINMLIKELEKMEQFILKHASEFQEPSYENSVFIGED